MAKIPFHVKYKPQIESGEYKVVNSYGEPVRIICWDAHIDFPNGIRPIISLQLIDQKYEVVSNHLENGKIYSFKDAPADLFIVTPEEEPTEFEKFMDKVVDDAIRETYSKDGFYDICRDALALAKKELARQGEVITLDKLAPYDKGFQDGKAEALKDLPKWKLYRRGSKIDSPSVVRFKDGAVGRTKCALEDCYVLEVEEMLKLSPFNEEKK